MSESNISRYSYVIEIMKQVKGFQWYLTISSIVRILSKLSSASIAIAVAYFLGYLLDGKETEITLMLATILSSIALKIIISY